MKDPANVSHLERAGHAHLQIRGSGASVSGEEPVIGAEFVSGRWLWCAARAIELDFLALLQWSQDDRFVDRGTS